MKDNNGGFITLLSVLIVSAVGVAISISLILIGIGTTRTTIALEQSQQTKALVNACAETALERIRDTNFTGTANLTIGSGTCTYTVVAGVGQNRTITVSGTLNTIVRKLSISVTSTTPSLTVSSWQEVP